MSLPKPRGLELPAMSVVGASVEAESMHGDPASSFKNPDVPSTIDVNLGSEDILPVPGMKPLG